MKTLKSLFAYFKPYLGIMIAYVLVGLIIISLAMLLPQITRIIVASVIQDEPFSLSGFTPKSKDELFLFLACAWIGIVIVRQGLSYLRSYVMTVISCEAVCRLREDAFAKMLSQSQTFLRNENTGNILTIINHDPEAVKHFFSYTCPAVFEALFGFIFASVAISAINPNMLLLCYAFFPFIIIVSRSFNQVGHKYYHLVRDSSADLSMAAQENLTGIRIVKAYAREKNEIQKFDKANNQFRYHSVHYMEIWAKYFVPFSIIGRLPDILLTILALYLTCRGQMTLAEFIAVSGYITYIITPFQNMNTWINQYQQALISGEKVFNFLAMGSYILSPPDAKLLQGENHVIQFKNVSFSSNGKLILSHINLDLPQGKRLGIMGATGSGKTAISNLVMRFFDTSEGKITIDNNDIRSLDLTSLRSIFSPVIQDIFLFSETIEKNISFGMPDATHEDVVRCAKIAMADEFISKMPDGYNTIIGERGMGLSGGQKQRISIARALLRNAPVLILDDATSALDAETEQQFQESLRTDCVGKTQIIIAHRVASVKDCDEIIMLKHGKIVERGTHDTLLAANGEYSKIFNDQYNAMSPDDLRGM